MLSERKVLIRVAEFLGLAGSAGAICTALAVDGGLVAPQRVESFLLPLLMLGLIVFAMAATLSHEFARQLHGTPGLSRNDELSIAELKLLLQWCPKHLRLAFIAAAAVLAYALLFIGAVEWSTNQPFTEREAKGFPLFTSVFMLVAVPILASASRMPGSFAEHFPSSS